MAFDGVNTGSLRELTAALDPTSTARLIDAFTHRSGWHVAGITHTTTGRQDPPALAAHPSSEMDWRSPAGQRLRRNEERGKGASWTGC